MIKTPISGVFVLCYDIVIKLRPDIYLKEKIIFEVDNNVIYIPKDNKTDKSKLTNVNDNYICDMIAFGKPLMQTAAPACCQ